jgi:hypothetical protein
MTPTPEAARWSTVALVDAGSRWISADRMKAIPATTSAMRPELAPRLRSSASAKHVVATSTMAMSTAAAAGMPGTASLLMVRETGS